MPLLVQKEKGYLATLVGEFAKIPPFEKLVGRLSGQTPEPVTIAGLAGSSNAIMLSELAKRTDRPIVAVMADSDSAADLYDDLSFLHDNKKIGHFPARRCVPYEFRSPTAEITAQRLYTLSMLLSGSLEIVVTSIEALIEPTIGRKTFDQERLYIKAGQEMAIEDLATKLVAMGFNRETLVEEIGDFSLRGGLVDFFSPGFDYPIRVEFFGDEIDTIRHFDVSSQRTTGRLDEVLLLPRREVPITQETVERYISNLPENDADLVRARYLNDPDLPGLEWLAGSFGIDGGCLTDFMDNGCIYYLGGYDHIKGMIKDIFETAGRHRERILDRMTSPPEVSRYYANLGIVQTAIERNYRIDHIPFKRSMLDLIDFECKDHPALGSRLDWLDNIIGEFRAKGIRHLVAADNPGQAARLGELIADKVKDGSEVPIEVAPLKGGFVSEKYKLAVLTDHQIFGRYFRRVRRKKFKEGVAIQNYTSLEKGDYVVHSDHGIARYIGLTTIEVGGNPRDCLHLQYANGDKLYVPIEEFNYVSKYAGKDAAPKLSMLGGSAWEKIKARTKKAVADMAEELLKIYAERKTRPGFQFGPDTTWQRQLEASFPYEETPDQIKAINAIKMDMERPQAMDRLVCGDVGYGKTEVAIRAAFKAIEAGKQVAVLVPTTILAQQHLTTFKERLKDFPVKIEMLSRFRTRKEQTAIVDDLAAGKIEIIIGTHRLLSKDVRFKDLGLLIVDEEQRFGVKHKETIRKIKSTVDTIAMTATPIPRTLHMSLSGVRDMSLINTSPKDRLPIITEIREFEPETIADAILREIDRGGQVFFVHNRVQTIEAMYRYLKKLIPQVEIGIAHGQMHERSLEGIMLAFLAGRFNVLLSTTIIESGLDIPSVNTMIINRADRFGLAQLYQLRGRVGRSSKRAYAYLLTPAYRLLTDDARKRLRAIETHSDLGSGFALAMKDLEIRGAGNILGPQQSGFIEEVGFDLYTKLLEEAVAELKGEKVLGTPDTKLDTDMEMMIPGRYISINQQKVDIYQKIAGAKTLDEIERIRDEVEDRFGRLPQETANLFEAAAVRISAWANDIMKVVFKKGRAELTFDGSKKFDRKQVESWRQAVNFPMEFQLSGSPKILIDLTAVPGTDRLNNLRGILNKV